MKTFKIRIIAKFNTKNELFIPGEVHEARRISYNLMDFKTPFQIVSGKKSGEEVPFKYAAVVPDEPQPTQQQFDELAKQNGELQEQIAASKERFSEISDALGEYEGHLIPAIRQLVQDKAELLQTIERHTDEQLNTEKLLQRIRELETIAQGRDEMIKSIKSVSVVIRDKRNPVELPRDVAKAIEGLRGFDFSNYGIIACDEYADDVQDWITVIRGYLSEVNTPENEMSNGDKLMLALINGYTIASKNDELADEIDSLTSGWFHDKMGENNRQDLNKVIYEFMRDLDKTAV
ncbi:hypothetical protein UY286_21705 [Paenibacillus polymyxa]|uniref:hypothetical protein n=1 Tax=Paenibacillus polymyxa TaxID=1406 RepID=UPI002AB48940|nr:hypothetical protein [Paenibacillus polymyxa]MDY7993343.1 hypothetical protein [Paenibacillus polymyxa]MDY8120056.1 hypothetical protein [Paenibacillus polymyxa]